MRVGVVGSRNYRRLDKVVEFVSQLPSDTDIVSGGAMGPDTVAVETAVWMGFNSIVFRADWEKYGKSAGYLRNSYIVESSDILVAFWDGKSRGTAHSIRLAQESEVPVETVLDGP